MTENATDNDHVHTLVLNALAATVKDEPSFLAGAESRTLLSDVFRAVTTPEQRKEFRTTVTRAKSVDGLTDENAVRRLRQTTSAVVSELADRDVEAVLDHTVELSLPSRETSLYTFANTRDPTTLDRLDLPDDVRTLVKRGGRHAGHGEGESCADAFERAVTESAGGQGAVATRILAALANHWRGADDRAVDFVEEALHLDIGALSARLVGLAADHPYSQEFRERRLGAQVFLRYTIDTPARSAVTPRLGVGETASRTWTDLDSAKACLPIERLEPTTWIRFELRGALPAFPAVHGYYIGLGVIDLETFEPMDVEQVLLSGPQTVTSAETLRFE